MTEREKDALQRIWQTFRILPPGKREYLLGYAEGVIAGASSQANAIANSNPAQPSAPA